MSEKKRSKRKQPADKVRRPANQFILFRRYHHPLAAREHPDLSNCQLSKVISQRWSALSPDQKAYWKRQQDKEMETFKRLHPGYKYKPRKSGEIKRKKGKRRASS